MEEFILSDDLKKDLEKIIKKKIWDITKEDLDKISKISLNRENYDATLKDYNLKDLFLFENLKSITFCNFKFNKNDIEIINKLSNLSFVYFDFCDFELDVFNFSSNIKCAVFNVCKTLKVGMLRNTMIEVLKVNCSKIERETFNILDVENAPNLLEISINNFEINNVKEVLNVAPKLTKINFDGSKVDDDKVINNFDIDVSNKETYIRANA